MSMSVLQSGQRTSVRRTFRHFSDGNAPIAGVDCTGRCSPKAEAPRSNRGGCTIYQTLRGNDPRHLGKCPGYSLSYAPMLPARARSVRTVFARLSPCDGGGL
jgi:hypothetical protein